MTKIVNDLYLIRISYIQNFPNSLPKHLALPLLQRLEWEKITEPLKRLFIWLDLGCYFSVLFKGGKEKPVRGQEVCFTSYLCHELARISKVFFLLTHLICKMQWWGRWAHFWDPFALNSVALLKTLQMPIRKMKRRKVIIYSYFKLSPRTAD